MKHLVGYIKDNSRINYKEIPSIYTFEETDSQQFNKYLVVIVDMSDLDKGLKVINECRNINSHMPVIWLLDYKQHLKIHDYLTKINGVGRLTTMPYGDERLSRIDDQIESLLNPNLPVKKEEIAFVIPVYNEAKRFHHVRHFVEKIMDMKTNDVRNLSIYFIDDGSSDQSTKLLENLINDYEASNDMAMVNQAFTMRKLKCNTKKAGTYIEAFEVIDADTIIFADADDGYEFEDIMRMLNLLDQGYYDMIVGTKDLLSENRPPVRRFISACKRMLTKPLLPKGVTDSQTGLKVFKKEMLSYILPGLNTSYGLAIDLKILNAAKKNRLRVYEMPVRFIDREMSHVDIVKDSIKFVQSILKISFTSRKGCMK